MDFREGLVHSRRRMISGLAGQPEFVVNIVARDPDTFDLHPQDQAPAAFDQPMEGFTIDNRTREWLESARLCAAAAGADTRDMWVLVAAGASGVLSFSTCLGDGRIVAVRNKIPATGAISRYVRFHDFDNAARSGAEQFSVSGAALFCVHSGSRHEIETKEKIRSRLYHPVVPPSAGYSECTGLGRAIKEADAYVKDKPDSMLRHCVMLIRRDGPSGLVDVVGSSECSIYRREVPAPFLKGTLCLDFGPASSLLSDTVAVLQAGEDYIWIMTSGGMVFGLRGEEGAPPGNFEEAIGKHEGRVDLTHDEMGALRRALAYMRTRPRSGPLAEVVLTPRGRSGRIELSDGEFPVSIPCAGHDGEPIHMQPKFLAEALAIPDIHAIEFEGDDPDHAVAFVGPHVMVAVMPVKAKELK